jgi:hypothetical protein
MSTIIAALIYRPDEVSIEALKLGVAIATAGYDLPMAHLDLAPLEGGWSVAFYTSGERPPAHTPEDELEHVEELFDEELSPLVAVSAAAFAERGSDVTLHGLILADDFEVDEGYALTSPDGPGQDDDLGGLELLSRVLGRPAKPLLMKALFDAERRVSPTLADPSEAGVQAQTRALVTTLKRVEGRGAPDQAAPGEIAPIARYRAFAATYDWADPGDPKDLYRGVSLGKVEGTVRFFRPSELPGFLQPRSGATPLFPVAELLSSNLAEPRRVALLAIDDGALLHRVTQASAERAGPTLSELLRYLSLGFRARSAFEEELIQALMLRAAVRARG